MTITGTNKKAITAPKKNILPPFEDKGWINAGNGARDVVANGSELSFSTTGAWYGFIYNVPLSYAGKTLSISANEARGSKPEVKLSWAIGDTWDSRIIYGAGKSENVKIPNNVTTLRVYVQSGGGSTGGSFYFKEVQLEEGSVATSFDSKVNSNKAKKKRKVIQTITSDFKGKVAGSVNENPHIMKGNGVSNTLQSPSGNWDENSQANYDLVNSLDGKLRTTTANISAEGAIPHQLYSFNVIRMVERELGEKLWRFSDSLESKLNIARKSIKLIRMYHSGNGSNPNGNRLNLTFFNGKMWHDALAYHVNGSITTINRQITMSIESSIQSDGFVHFVAFTEMSNSVKPSVINTDYVYLMIEVEVEEESKEAKKPSSKKNLLDVNKIFADTSITLDSINPSTGEFVYSKKTAESANGFVGIWVDVKPNTDYKLSYNSENGGNIWIYEDWFWGKAIVSATAQPQFNSGGRRRVLIGFYTGTRFKTARVWNAQLEEGSTQTEFEPYTPMNKTVKGIVKAPVKKHPFDFRRESVEIMDGIQYGINQPRIKDGGIFIEEGTTNLIDFVRTYTSGMKVVPDSTYLYEGKQGFCVERTILSGTNYGGFRFDQVQGKTYYASAIVYDPHDQFERGIIYDVASITNELTGTAIGKKTPLGKNWYLIEFKYTATKTSTPTSHGFIFYPKPTGGGNLGDKFYVFDVQVEEKYHKTSYTSAKRNGELLTAPTTIDGQGGSIEVDVDFSLNTTTQYLFDTDGSRWLLYRTNGNLSVFQVYLDGVNKMSIPISSIPNGRNKIVLKWTSSTCEVLVNGVSVATGSHTGNSNVSKLYIGRRQNDIEFINATYHSFVVRDRNGKITFKM
ncbi:TPA: hypothetical protein ACORDH_002768 [Bacillus cereus]